MIIAIIGATICIVFVLCFAFWLYFTIVEDNKKSSKTIFKVTLIDLICAIIFIIVMLII